MNKEYIIKTLDEYRDALSKQERLSDTQISVYYYTKLEAIKDIKALLFEDTILDKETASVCYKDSVKYNMLIEKGYKKEIYNNDNTTKKYLITSDYQYYDDFSFSVVGVCDTKEQAEKMITHIKAIKEILLAMEGFVLIINKELTEEEIFGYTYDYFPEIPNVFKYNSNDYRIFLNSEHYYYLKDNNFLSFDDDTDMEFYEKYNKTNFFSFASLYISCGDLDTKGFLNDEKANLNIKEINYFKEKE
jgi:hypothetical protein